MEEFEPIALEEMDRVLMVVSSVTCILVLYPPLVGQCLLEGDMHLDPSGG